MAKQFPSPGVGPTEVVKGLLWLGCAADANDERFIRENNIQCIINAAGPEERTSIEVEGYMELNAMDVMDYPILQQCSERALTGMALAMHTGKPTLIHCAMGINRSTALLADFLSTITGVGAKQMIPWLRSLRSIVLSNPSFVRQLLEKHPQ